MECRSGIQGVRGILAVSIILVVAVGMTTAQTGFVSIDCGGNSSNYTDHETQIQWTNDEKYVPYGLTGRVPSIDDPTIDNQAALETFRFFPSRRSKHCYTLSASGMNTTSVSTARSSIGSVLVRAMFLHGGAEVLSLPISFDAYVNSSFWDSIEYTADQSLGDLQVPKVLEGIFPLIGDTVYVCLVPRQGTPFISSLEMRELDPGGMMYPFENYEDREDVFLSRIIRWNVGQCTPKSTVRYPNDPYDRIWLCPLFGFGEYTGSPFINPIANSSRARGGGAEENYVPGRVMSSGLVPTESNEFRLTVQLPLATSAPVYAYAVLYFLDLNPSSSTSGSWLVMNTSFQEEVSWGVLVSKDNVTSRTYQRSTVSSSIVSMAFAATDMNRAIINAFEIYEKKVVDHYSTHPHNVDLVYQLKENFGLPGEGDPCMPVPHEWLTCTPSQNLSIWKDSGSIEKVSQDNYVTYLESITISHLTNTTKLKNLAFRKYFALVLLQSMSIIHSDLDDSTFHFLTETISSIDDHAYITSLDVTNNSISIFNPTIVIKNPVLNFINLSQNHLQGAAPSFDDLPNPVPNPILVLNMSHNQLSSFPESWESTPITDYPGLETLDFTNNQISNLSSLIKFVQQDHSALTSLYISNNKFYGEFPSELYFSTSSSLENLYMNHNNFHGTLDLSSWKGKMDGSIRPMVLSLVNNSITDISPNIDILQSFFYKLSNPSSSPKSGILLGGNPYCKGASGFPQLYLCRSSMDEIVQDNPKEGRNVLRTVGAVLGGFFGAVICAAFFLIIIRLRKQVQDLKEFQVEMAAKRVQPPLYSFQDLRTATKDFHQDNKLGSGSYGTVYKGELQDGSQVAVKVLHNEKQDTQVLDRFLNEVVLITGIKHKHLVQLQGCCIYGKKKILVYEFVENGDVASALWGKEAMKHFLSWDVRLNICIGIARGLAYLHEELQLRIIHRDIKAANVLLDKQSYPKIADFGLAKSFQEEDTHAQFTNIAGTRGYWAPEYVLDGQLTQKADIYSFGILVLEIVSGRPCVVSTLPEEQVSLKIWAETLQEEDQPLHLLQPELRYSCNEEEVKTVIETALLCLEADPKLRPTMSAVVFMLVEGMEILESMTRDAGDNDDSHRFRFRPRHRLMRALQRSGEIDEEDDDEDVENPLIGSSGQIVNLHSAEIGGRGAALQSLELGEGNPLILCSRHMQEVLQDSVNLDHDVGHSTDIAGLDFYELHLSGR